MTLYTYTGNLTDFADAPFPSASPRLWVQPDGSAFSPTGPAAPRRIPLALDSEGAFSVDLHASIDMIPPTNYWLRCDWFTVDEAGTEVLAGWAEWEFTAQPGGGNIATMPNKLTRVWYATTPPPIERSGIYWIHPTTGDVREWVA